MKKLLHERLRELAENNFDLDMLKMFKYDNPRGIAEKLIERI